MSLFHRLFHAVFHHSWRKMAGFCGFVSLVPLFHVYRGGTVEQSAGL